MGFQAALTRGFRLSRELEEIGDPWLSAEVEPIGETRDEIHATADLRWLFQDPSGEGVEEEGVVPEPSGSVSLPDRGAPGVAHREIAEAVVAGHPDGGIAGPVGDRQVAGHVAGRPAVSRQGRKRSEGQIMELSREAEATVRTPLSPYGQASRAHTERRWDQPDRVAGALQ